MFFLYNDLNQSKETFDSKRKFNQQFVRSERASFHSRADSQSPSKDSDKEEESGCRQGRKQNFSKESTQVLKRWLIENVEHPYLKAIDKNLLSRESGLTKKQVQNWFTNIRKRVWQPLMNKFKNKKDLKKIILKLKLKLDSSDENSINEDSSQLILSQKGINQVKEEDRLINSKEDSHQSKSLGKRASRQFDQDPINNQFSQMHKMSGQRNQISQYEEEKQSSNPEKLQQSKIKNFKNKKDITGDSKVNLYLEQMAQFNQKQQKIKEQKMEDQVNSSENRSNNSIPGGNDSGASNNSNHAYCNSSNSGIINNSAGPTSGPNVGSSGGGGSSGNSNIQYVPIMVVCCPNILKNEQCPCGHQSFVTMPSQLQLHQYLNQLMANGGSVINNSSTGSSSNQNMYQNNCAPNMQPGNGHFMMTGSTMSSNPQMNVNDQNTMPQLNTQNPNQMIQDSQMGIQSLPQMPNQQMGQQQNFNYFHQQNNLFRNQLNNQMHPFQSFCNSSSSSGHSSNGNLKQDKNQNNYWNINFPNVHLPKPSVSQIRTSSINGSNGGSNGSN
eukprot:403359865